MVFALGLPVPALSFAVTVARVLATRVAVARVAFTLLRSLAIALALPTAVAPAALLRAAAAFAIGQVLERRLGGRLLRLLLALAGPAAVDLPGDRDVHDELLVVVR